MNFYRATQDRDPDTLAGAVALTFMGARNTHWDEQRRREMAAFFSRLAFKSTQEWKEEIVCWNWEPLDVPDVVFPDGTQSQVSANEDPRQVFADWLITRENPWFAHSVVNRVWFWLLGRGIVHEPDDMGPDNPASNSALLDYLAEELRRADYDLKHIYRMILNSHTYQQSSVQNVAHPEAEALFAHYLMRRIEAEVLEDALCRIFRVDVGYQSDIPEPSAYIPPQQSTVSLADGSISSPFLKTFGRPSRDRGFELDRKNDVTESHRLFFINSTELNGWINENWWIRNAVAMADRHGRREAGRRRPRLNNMSGIQFGVTSEGKFVMPRVFYFQTVLDMFEGLDGHASYREYGVDARFMRLRAKAARIQATYESFTLHGKSKANFTAAIASPAPKIRNRSVLYAKSYEREGSQIVALGNDGIDRIFVTLTFTNIEGGKSVWLVDRIAGTIFGGKDGFGADQLTRGVLIDIPHKEFRILEVHRELTDPAFHAFVTFDDTEVRAKLDADKNRLADKAKRLESLAE